MADPVSKTCSNGVPFMSIVARGQSSDNPQILRDLSERHGLIYLKGMVM